MALKQLQYLCFSRSNLFYHEPRIGYLNVIQFLSLLIDDKEGIECQGLKNYAGQMFPGRLFLTFFQVST